MSWQKTAHRCTPVFLLKLPLPPPSIDCGHNRTAAAAAWARPAVMAADEGRTGGAERAGLGTRRIQRRSSTRPSAVWVRCFDCPGLSGARKQAGLAAPGARNRSDLAVCAGGQRSNVGMLPPSDSDDDSDEGKEGAEQKEKKPASKAAAKAGQSKNAGKLPPSDSEDEDEDDSDSESEEESSEEPLNEYLASSAPRKK